jgi:hypothetical protein
MHEVWQDTIPLPSSPPAAEVSRAAEAAPVVGPMALKGNLCCKTGLRRVGILAIPF